MKKAVILLSGGLDSATCLAIAKNRGFEPYALSFDYGQRHGVELDRAKDLAQSFNCPEHKIANIDLRLFGGSALTADDLDVPKNRSNDDISHGVPITYVPARNTIFLSFALSWAEILQATDIFIGVNAIDYSGYPDCRAEFISAYEKMANLATAYATEQNNTIKIHTPLIDLTKADIIKLGAKLGVDYSKTISCYDPDDDGRACGACDSCILRKKGLQMLGLMM